MSQKTMCTSPEEKNDVHNVVRELICLARSHKSIVDSKISSMGLRREQHSALMEILKSEKLAETDPTKSLAQKDIAERFGVSTAAIAMMMKKLEAAGYISRKMSPLDNRYNELHLTDKGRDVLEKTKEMFDEIDAQTYKGLTEEECQVMLRCIEKMKKNLSEMPGFEGDPRMPRGYSGR